MKVLQINAIYEKNSTGRSVMELHDSLIETGISSYVASSNIGMEGKSFYRMGNLFDRKTHGLLSRITGLQGYYSYFETQKLLNWIDQINPDIVHLHNLHGNYVNLMNLLKYLGKNEIATVITLHDCWFFTGKCVYYSEDDCERWKQNCGECPCLHKGNPSWFFDRSTKMLKDKKKAFLNIHKLAVVGVSKWISNESKMSILQTATINTYIYNWINQDVFYPRNDNVIKMSLLNDKYTKYILSVATTWNEAKGLNDIFKLSNKLKTNELLILIGNVSEKIELPENIKSIGSINDVNLLAKYYSAADVFVNLSIQETFGKVTAEALCCGTPVIVYNSTACPELVTAQTGCVVPLNDIDGVCNSIEYILNKGKDEYRVPCVEFANANFNYENNVKKYVDLFYNLLH